MYGVSRSGKDYLLERVVTHLSTQGISAIHIKGSATLNELSQQQYGIPLKKIDEEKRTILRQQFIEIVEKSALTYEVVFVDGHYAFIDDGRFYTVLTEADKYCYDHFFYLDTLTEKIIEFSRVNPKTSQDLSIQTNEIDAWKQFEISGLGRICDELGKELVILDENTQSSIQFITYWIKFFSDCFDYLKIAQKLVQEFLQAQDKQYSNVVLLDGDNTLASNDTTYDFCDFLQIEKSSLKRIFYGDRYSSYQFFQMQNIYQYFDKKNIEKATGYAVSKIQISKELWTFVNQHVSQTYVCILTSGLFGIWQGKADELGGVNKVWGNWVNKAQEFFVTPMLKKQIALAFQKNGIQVIAVGDSIIDIPMLEIANQGYIVAHKKLNLAAYQYFLGNPNSMIRQILTTQWQYPISQYLKSNL